MKPPAALFFASIVAFTPVANGDAKDCDDGVNGALQTAQCLGQIVEKRRETVQTLYLSALTKIPDTATDARSTRQQFELEQAAWEKYESEHCAFYGGVSEGASAWISLASARCELKELDSRIGFLKNIPWNPERYPSD